MLLLLFNQPASGTPAVSLGATEGPDVADFTVANRAAVALGATEAPDTASFAVDVVSVTPSVVLGATESPDVASFSVLTPAVPSTSLVTGGGQHVYPPKPKAKSSKQLLDELLDEVDKVVDEPKELLEVTSYPELVDTSALRAAFLRRKQDEEEEENETLLLLA